jgi:hypothetical protein
MGAMLGEQHKSRKRFAINKPRDTITPPAALHRTSTPSARPEGLQHSPTLSPKHHLCKPWFTKPLFTDCDKSLDRPLTSPDNIQQAETPTT